MISFTSAQLSAWVAALIFPLARILALIASAPVLGNRQIPRRVKVGLAVLITAIIAPTLDIPAGLDPASAEGFLVLIQQILAGLTLGFAMRLVFTAIEMAGNLAGMQMGLGFATFYDPVNAGNLPIVAQFFGIIALLLFLSVDAHLYMIAALVDSFQSFPISTEPISAGAFRTMLTWGGALFTNAVQLALPLIGILLITNIALGILARSAPQLNIFAIGFPITMGIGFATILIILPYISPALNTFTQQALNVVERMMQQYTGQ